jgi:hypothetical protein
MTTTAYEQVLHLVRQLDRQSRARLVAEVVQDLAVEPVIPAPPPADAWARWTALGDDIRQRDPHADIAGRLAADRRERDAAIGGHPEDDNVRH